MMKKTVTDAQIYVAVPGTLARESAALALANGQDYMLYNCSVVELKTPGSLERNFHDAVVYTRTTKFFGQSMPFSGWKETHDYKGTNPRLKK